MRVVITQANLTLRGGAERVVLEIAKHYNAKIYTAEYDAEHTFEEFRNIDIEVIGKKSALSLLPYNRISQGLNYGMAFYSKKLRDEYDIINAHVAPSHWIRNKNERVLWYCHTPLRDVYDLYKYRLSTKKRLEKPAYILGATAVRRIDRRVIGRIEGVVTNSRNTKMRIMKFFGRNDAKIINPGIDAERYSNNGDGKYFFYPSRFSPNKRQEYAIKAFDIFKRKYKKNGYKLVLAGSVSRDRFYYDYYRYIRELASEVQDVEVIENAEDEEVIKLLAGATAVLYTPLDEDFGIVPLEAMASMKPIIAVNQGGPRETVVNGKTGYLVRNEEEMAESMNFLVEHPKISEELGKEGKKIVETKYTWRGFFEKFDKAVKRVAGASGVSEN
ncbi:MAG: glycosyltransferase [Candidatus Micrarchaeaceae archaeon]